LRVFYTGTRSGQKTTGDKRQNMLKLLAKIFGDKSQKDIKLMMPLVEQTKKEGELLISLSNDELRNKTVDIQNHINEKLKAIDDQIAALHKQIADVPDMDINEKESVFKQIDKLELDRNKELEKVLMGVLPRAFAIVKETARRFKENESLEVTATELDRILAAKHENIKIVRRQSYLVAPMDGSRKSDYLGHGALRCSDHWWYCLA
jgi:preprotein translocase subunit SecA